MYIYIRTFKLVQQSGLDSNLIFMYAFAPFKNLELLSSWDILTLEWTCLEVKGPEFEFH